ncbi:MAG: S8 family serine peptidase [Caldimonas sp.]
MRALLLALAISALAATATAADAGSDTAAAGPDPQQQVLVLLNLPAAHFRADGNYASGYADANGRAARRRIATTLAQSHGLALLTEWPMPIVGLDCYVMVVPDARRADEVAGMLSRDPRVGWAQAMNVFRPLAHDDPLFTLQPAAAAWHLADLHAAATGRDVRIAVIDSGVQLDHPDLAGQVESSANLVADRPWAGEIHGTAVAGIIAARADNRIGIVGVAPRARLLALRSCNQQAAADTSCTTLGLALALGTAIERGAQIINLSLGGPPDRLVRRLVDAALARRIAVVVAVDRSAERGGFPAGLEGVVAAIDEPAPSAPPGTLVAPGRDVPTTVPPSRWATVSGASYAAAHVSGLLALVIELQGRSGRSGTPAAAELVVQADGRVDACASLARARAACVCACAATPAMESLARH